MPNLRKGLELIKEVSYEGVSMFSLRLKTLVGGLFILLIAGACSTISKAVPTTQAIEAASPTASPIPATTVPTVMPIPPLPAPDIQSLTMLDENNGWAIFDGGVARTADGGITWHNATPADFKGTAFGSFFLDASNGWVAVMGSDPTSSSLYHTIDGGITWRTIAVPFGGGLLYFVDALNGWELVGLGAGMSHEAVAIFRTNDGGNTWTQVFTNDPNVSGSRDSLPLVGDKNGISALDTAQAWVTGSEPVNDFIYLYYTQDGGTTWSHQDIALPIGYSGTMINTLPAVIFGKNEIVLPLQLYADTVTAGFLVSHDGGQTWSAATPVPQGGQMAVASPNDFFVWDGGAVLYVSHNAGETWSTINPNIDIKDNLGSYQFLNVGTGWALSVDMNSHRTLYRTTDGGATWNVLIP
jgi:photosystem II stability/assembly factor-like uncharacterized protein